MAIRRTHDHPRRESEPVAQSLKSGMMPLSQTNFNGRLKPYPSYKDSGVEWLGRIPAQWRVKRLKYAVRSGRKGGMLIKGQMANEPADGFFPGYSASGQDVWVDEAEYHEPGIVLSAVGARCGKAFRADGDWT